jgi:hypothetical protein
MFSCFHSPWLSQRGTCERPKESDEVLVEDPARTAASFPPLSSSFKLLMAVNVIFLKLRCCCSFKSVGFEWGGMAGRGMSGDKRRRDLHSRISRSINWLQAVAAPLVVQSGVCPCPIPNNNEVQDVSKHNRFGMAGTRMAE